MFWRIFLSFLLLVVAAVALVGGLVLRRNEGARLIDESAAEVTLIALGIAGVAVFPAYLLARQLTRPLLVITAGARRLAAGNFEHKVRTAGGPEFAALARALNAMSDRLAGTFAQLEHDRQQLRTILSGMVEGVVAFDPDQRVLFANERAGELLEFAPAAAVGRKLWEVTRQPAVRGVVDRALAGDGPCRAELDWTGPGAKHLGVYVSRLPAAGGPSPGAVMVLHDTTELRRLERLRQDFVANVSHELKTPLAVIRSNVEALQDGAADDPAARGLFLDRVQVEAARLGALIQDLLRLARIESGAQPLDPRPVRLDEAIAECLDRHSSRAEEKTLQLIEVPPADGPVAAWADDEAVSHVLDNLVDNAVKYTPNGGKITVRWGAAGNRAWVEVQDTGIGIGPKDLPRVFERFYRADKARSRDHGGTGLGLAIVKHLASAMGGEVEVSSRAGKGTTFRVTLPRSEQEKTERG